MEQLQLLPTDEFSLRAGKIAAGMEKAGIDMAIITDNAVKYYLTGRVFSGWIVLDTDAVARYFVRRPIHLEDANLHMIRKPEEIPALLPADLLDSASVIGFAMSTMSVNDFNRLTAVFAGKQTADISGIIRAARAVKTPMEIARITRSGELQERVYRTIPALYRPGMTDIRFQIEIERALRLGGCLGQFRISGDSMELFMGNILAGDNADNPTPYDFAMGGAGIDPSLPVGADNTMIANGMTVMVDANGNFTGYMTDMTRTFRRGEIPAAASAAHRCSVRICSAIAQAAVPGTKASDLYELACGIVSENGLTEFFMGHRQKAGFIGHGVGIEINEAPVIAPRSRDIIEVGNVIALEPKFVIPGTGAVGIENTYVAESHGLRCLTNAPEDLFPL